MTTKSTQLAARPTQEQIEDGLSQELEAMQNSHKRMTEALSRALMMLKSEDVGWAGHESTLDYTGLELDKIKKWSNEIRASLTGSADGLKAPNPHMRQGLMLRHSFIWEGDMHYEGLDKQKAGRGVRDIRKLIEEGQNARLVFSPPARRRRESALYTDGLYLLVGENATKSLRPIPMNEITETQRSDLYQDEIVAYRWTRREIVRNADGTIAHNGERQEKSYWVYVDWYSGKKPDHINYNGNVEDVLKGHTAFDMHANRPDGQAFGSPDAIAAVVWARVIRDLIMNGVHMQDALAMFAFKGKAATKEGQQTQALELGERQEAGSVANLAGDADLVPMNTAGKGYDFSSIGFVVSTMAASLHVPGIALSSNTALAGASYGAAKTLDLPNRMAMETRRKEHLDFDRRILKWMNAKDVSPSFNNYDDSTDEMRAVQAAYIAFQSGTLSAEGFRNELEIIYGRKLMGPIPDGVLLPNNENSLARRDIDTDGVDGSGSGGKASSSPATQAASALQGKSTGTGGSGHANDLPAPGKAGE